MDDAGRVALARDRPGEGWAAIWDHHGPGLHSYCQRMLGDRSDADDVVADVFLAAAQRIDQLRDPSALRAWLFAIARRSVQQRWRQRSRTVPVDPHGATVMNQATDDDHTVESSDAAALLDAAAEGLSPKDRELLALTLGADLDTTEVARITGERTNAVSVRVTRLKETVGRAAGALLVARSHRRDCDELDVILADWDGTFDTVWRKRIARHIEDCDTCDERRRAATTVFAAPLLLAPPSAQLRDRVLEPIRSGRHLDQTPDPSSFDPGPLDVGGFPIAHSWPGPRSSKGSTRALAVMAAGVLVVLLAVLAAGVLGGGDSEVAAGATSTSAGLSTSSDPTTTSSSTTSSMIEPRSSAPGAPSGTDELTEPTSGSSDQGTTSPSIVTPSPSTTATSTTMPPAAPPAVSLSVSPSTVSSCSGVATATVVVGAGSGGETTVVSWDGGEPGQTTVEGVGSFEVEVGPLVHVEGGPSEQTIEVRSVTTDRTGARAADEATVVHRLEPC